MTKPSSGKWHWYKWWPRRWRGDQSVQVCSLSARGAWREILDIMHLAETGGYLLIGGEVPSSEDIARLLGCTEREWKTVEAELERRKVFSRRTSDGAIYCRSRVREAESEGSPSGYPEGDPTGTPPDIPSETHGESEGRPPSRALSPLSSSPSSGGGRGGGRKREASAEAIDGAFKAIPKLDTPECRAAWDRWMQHRREIGKPVTPTSAHDAIHGYAQRGPKAFLEAIAHTIARGWQGLRDPAPGDRAGLAPVTHKASAEPPDAEDIRSRWMIAQGRKVRDGKQRGVPDYPGYAVAKHELNGAVA